MKFLALTLVVAGAAGVTAGATLIYLPAGVILGGLLLGSGGLLIDYDHGGKRETARRASRT